MRNGAIIALAVLLVACAPARDRSADLAPPAEPLIWPNPPAEPRIQYLFGFRSPEDLGIRPRFLERLWSAIAGAENLEMVKPYALAAQGSRVAVTDPGLRAVHIYDMAAQDYRRLTGIGEVPLGSPVGVALSFEQTYVADSTLGKVFAFDRDGEFRFTIEGLQRPTGLAFDHASRRLYVADTLAHSIVVFDETGQRLFGFGQRGTGRGEFNYPTHVSIGSGKLHVNDTMNFRVQSFDLEGRPIASFGRHGDGSGDFAQPKGIATDESDHIYVADSLFDRIQIFDSQGEFLLAFGGSGSKAGAFWLPAGMFIEEDRIYVADSYNRRVQVFQFLGGQ